MGYREGDPTVMLEGHIEVTTAKAYLVYPTMGNLEQVWIPKSQVVQIENQGEGNASIFTVTEWWFNKSGIKY